MKPTHLRQWLLSLLFVATVLSCIDHRVPVVSPGSGPERLRVKTITQETPNSPTKVSAFKYDSQNRLSLIIGYETPDSSVAPVENTTYQYDGQNRLTQVQHTFVRRAPLYSFDGDTYTYSYNGAGQVSNLRHSPSTLSISPSYTSGNQPSGYGKSVNVAGLIYSAGGTFAFTGNNLTLATATVKIIRLGGPMVPVVDGTTSTPFTFDDKVNPFYGVFLIPAPGRFGPGVGNAATSTIYTYYGGIDNLFNLSQNNVLSAGSTTYNYAYNSANLPTIRITTTGGTAVETLYYEYETY
ncbi:hypothetical protein [Spirosoma areae]